MTNSFLQSESWAEFQRSLGRSVFKYDQDGIKSFVFKYDMPLKKWYLYVPHGPEMDFNSMTGGFQNPSARYIQWVRDLAKKEKAVFIKIEPIYDSVAQIFAQQKFKKSKKEIQPGKTIILDLTQSEEELLSNMHHKTRYNIKVSQKHDIRVSESEDLKTFWHLMKKTTKHDKFFSHPESYYKKQFEFFKNSDTYKIRLYLVYYQNDPVAGAVILNDRENGYYLHGASDHNFRQYMAPFALHWQIIKDLKSNGIQKYDLWGIDSHKWPGVTRFKLGWGGKTVEYPGSFDLPVSKFWYTMYKLIQKLRGK